MIRSSERGRDDGWTEEGGRGEEEGRREPTLTSHHHTTHDQYWGPFTLTVVHRKKYTLKNSGARTILFVARIVGYITSFQLFPTVI
jgi:hypothetical protein